MQIRFALAAATMLAGIVAAPAQAAIGYADTVLNYFNSGAGPLPGPYGGTFPGSFPVSVSTSVVLGGPTSPADFLSLPRGSFVTVGFTDETVVDGVGNDIFIREIGASGERASVFVSKDLINFIFLGTATDSSVTAFDLASIGWTGRVKAVKILGLDNFGGSPGFDVDYIQVLPGSIGAVPEPASWAMLIAGFGLTGAAARRRRTANAAWAICEAPEAAAGRPVAVACFKPRCLWQPDRPAPSSAD